MDDRLYYQSGYKYQVYRDWTIQTALKGRDIDTAFIHLERDGRLTAKRGYAWDGASGPTIDTKNSIRASLAHDMGYQLMRESLLPTSCRPYFDSLFYQVLRHDGMCGVRAWIWRRCVEKFAIGSCLAENDRKVLVVP
jgi:hypothetical protein